MIWKTAQWTVHLLFWIAIALVIYSFMTTNRRSARILPDGRIEFAQRWFAVWAWLFVMVRMSLFVPSFLRHAGEPWGFIAGACLGGAVLSSLFAIPDTLIVAEGGLGQVYWFRRNKRIRWDEIVEINSSKRIVTVTGANGMKIVHSAPLADRPRFLLELKQHCGENLPPDFPREPIATVQVQRPFRPSC